MQYGKSIPLKICCPPGCACKSSACKSWKHSCGQELYLSEYGNIYCIVCHQKPEKGCFAQKYPFQCSVAKTQQYFKSLAQFLLAYGQGIQSLGINLKDCDFMQFQASLTARVAEKWCY